MKILPESFAADPDGRWLAYEANNSGQFEVNVRPFPDVDAAGVWQVPGGGGRPLWARNGQEAFYLSPAGAEAGIARPSIVVVQPFDEELKRLVPTP